MAVVSSPQFPAMQIFNGLLKTGFPEVSDPRDTKIAVDYTDQSGDGMVGVQPKDWLTQCIVNIY